MGTLKIHVDSPSRLLCNAHIDIRMPFEMFMLVVNGETLNTYYMGHQELVTLSTGIGPGKHTVVFRIKNNDFDPRMERDVSHFGTGKVRLEDCEVRSLLH